MRIREIRVENVCQFDDLTWVFHPGLTGVVGPNGSGKSNLVKAIYFALTGTFRNAGVKADNVRQVPAAGRPRRSGVTLEFEHDGVAMSVWRSLVGPRTRLVVGREGEIRGEIEGDNAVTERIMDALGVDAKILAEYVFIRQAHLADFVDDTPGGRAAVFSRLFGTADCEAIYQLMTEQLAGPLAVAPLPDLDALEREVAGYGDAMATKFDELEGCNSLIAQLESDAPAARETLALAAKERAAREAVRAIEDALVGARNARATEEAGLTDAERDVMEASRTLSALIKEADAARVALATWDAVLARRARADATARWRQALEEDAGRHPRPVDPGPAPAGDEVAGLFRRVGSLADHVKLAEGGSPVCPTCGQGIDVLVENLDAMRAELEDLRGRLAKAQAATKAATAYALTMARWEQWNAAHEAELVRVAADEAVLAAEAAAMPSPEGDPEAFRAAVARYDAAAWHIVEIRRRRDDCRAAIERVRGRIEQLEADRDARLRELAGLATDKGAVVLAEAKIQTLEATRVERARVEGDAEATLHAMEGAQARLDAARAAAAAREDVIRLRVGAEAVRSVVHRQAAPRLVIESHLDRLADEVDDLLEAFGADFRVRLGRGLSFTADFPDGRQQDAPRLSGGQASVLALAFWVAVNSIFARELGFLSLDEPTAGLDQRHMAAVDVALRRLRSLAESSGLQCLLVTHESALTPLFDSVLRLS